MFSSYSTRHSTRHKRASPLIATWAVSKHTNINLCHKHAIKYDSALSASFTTTLKKEGNLKDKWQQQGTKKPHLFLSLVLKLGLVLLRMTGLPSRSDTRPSPSSPLFRDFLPSGVKVCHGLVAFPALHACESRVRQRATSTEATNKYGANCSAT